MRDRCSLSFVSLVHNVQVGRSSFAYLHPTHSSFLSLSLSKKNKKEIKNHTEKIPAGSPSLYLATLGWIKPTYLPATTSGPLSVRLSLPFPLERESNLTEALPQS